MPTVGSNFTKVIQPKILLNLKMKAIVVICLLGLVFVLCNGDSAEDTTVVANVGSSVVGDSESGESVEGSGDASGESAEDEVSDESPETEESPEQGSESDESDESVDNRPPQ